MKIDNLFENNIVGMFYQLYSAGELHVSDECLSDIRDTVNKYIGSINIWLETQPPGRSEDLSKDVSDILRVMTSSDPQSVLLEIFEYAVIDGKIGFTYMNSFGSFCLQALFAYRTYYLILDELIRRYEIPIIDTDTIPYPDFDQWFIDGVHMDTVKIIKEYEARFGIPDDMTIELPACSEEHYETDRKVEDAKVEAFRLKVISCCTVCKELDDMSREESEYGICN